jgi:hypothetical protein
MSTLAKLTGLQSAGIYQICPPEQAIRVGSIPQGYGTARAALRCRGFGLSMVFYGFGAVKHHLELRAL